MMRVLHITHYGGLYGANRSLLDLATGQRVRGVVPMVALGQDGPLRERLEAEGIACTVVPFTSWMDRRVYMGGPHHRLLQWWRFVRHRMRKEQQNDRAAHAIARWAVASGVDLVHAQSAALGITARVAGLMGVPYVQHVRELHREHYGYRIDGGEHRLARLLRGAAAVVVPSKVLQDAVHALTHGAVRAEVVPNGVVPRARLENLPPQAAVRWRSTVPFRFLQLGLFHPAKGQVEAVEALASLRSEGVDARLVQAGGGDQRAVRSRIAALDLQATVDLPGFVEDPTILFEGAHVLLNCSRHEAFGRTTWEAMAQGLPVIAHASGATPELVRHGHNGLLYRSPEELLAHMRMLARDPDMARRMGEEAFRTLPAAAGTEAMCEAVARLYCRITGRSAP
jgi:glycosyltransferase involved in cell wall biosynthesis